MKLNWKTLFLLTTCCTLGLMTTAKAQIIPDNSLGAENSNINPDSIQGISFDRIGGGATRGSNLFHSFQEFNVNNGQLVYFSNPAGIANILTRVTGVNRSNILGTLGVLGNANLFLINPNGIFFGPNASLDLGGSFFGSSANSLLFDNGFEFSATNPQAPPLLTVNIPIGLRFRDNPGNIINQSVVQDNTGFGIGLQVNPGNSLALVGGNVSLEQGGRLTAAGGRIELGGLAGAGTVGLQTTGNTFRLNFPTNGLSNVSLLDDARVAVRSNGGGDIAVNANIFTATNGGRLVGGIEGIATRNGGDITVNSNEFNISNVAQSPSGAGIYQQVIGDASGNAGGNIFVNTKSFNASSGGQLQNTVLSGGTGNAGNISVTSNSLSLTGGSEINTSTFGQGNAGNVTLRAENGDISFAGESFIFSTVESGQDNAGNPVITQRNAGKIDIIARNLTLTDSSQLQTLVSGGQQGNAGNITVQASGNVRIATNPGGNSSGIFSEVQSGASGNAGNITINAGSIFTDDALLTARNTGNGSAGNISLQVGDAIALRNGSVISSSIFGTGNAGKVTLRAENGDISLAGGSDIFSTVEFGGTGNAGDVTLRVENGDISLAGGSNIFSTVESGGMGNAGKIDVITRNLSLTDGSQLQTSLRAGQQNNAGNVTVQASGTVRIAGRNSDGNSSGIFSNVFSGASGNAGNITINAGSIFTDDALLRARNEGNGSAGNISLQVGDAIALTNGSRIDSSIFGTGNAGDVTLRTQNGDISLAGGSLIFSTVESGGMGNGGKIDVITRNFSLTNSSQLQTLVRPGQQGNAGNITVQANGTVRIADRNPGGNPSGIFSEVQSGASGDGGNIFINAGSIFIDDGLLRARNTGNGSAGDISLQVVKAIALTNGSEISSSIFGRGNAGDVTLRVENGDISLAGGSDIFSTVESGGMGNAGKIDVITRNLSLTDGSQLQTSLRAGQQNNAGNVTVQASGTVRIAGRNSDGNSSGIFSNVFSGASGNAGNITINAGSIFTDDALLRARNEGNGSAGNISLQVGDAIALTNGSRIDSSIFGTGNAGDVTLRTQNGDISLAGESLIFSTVESGGMGNGGKIDVITRNFSLTNSSQLQTLVRPGQQGNAGNITVQANGTVRIADRNPGGNPSGIFSEVQSGASGDGGNIFINAGSIFIDDGLLRARNTGNGSAGDISLQVVKAIALTNGSVINSNIFGRGNAGNVTLRAENGDISLAGGSDIFSTVESGGMGNAGKIDVITRNLSLTDGSQLQTLVRPGQQGNAGNITVQASGTVRIAGRNSNGNPSGIFSEVQSGASGNGGNIFINAGSIFTDDALLRTINAGTGSAGDISLKVGDAIALTNGSVINSSISGRGNAGNISLQVGNAIALSNSSLIRSVVESGGEGIGGDINIRGRSLTLTEGSQILTSLFREGNGLSGGKGRAGNIDINATDFVNIFGVGTTGFSSGLFASAERGTTAISPQAAGNINLTTGNFRIADGAVVDALTYNSGNAGNITINANTFTASGGGQVITTTFNSGSAGNINLNVRDRITISGSDPNFNQRIEGTFDNLGAASGIFANTARNSTGNGGNITIQPLQNRFPTIAISDGAEVTVDSIGTGRGGNLSITGNSLTLDRGVLNASTASGDGGNINLSLRNFIRLRNESLISASAGGNGNGGNITINSPFIVAFPRNNDIIANAGSGSGGRVTINASLFGINPLSAEDLRRLRPDDLDPRQLPTSDITAISRDNPSLSRSVQVNSPDVDPSRGLVELPEAVTDPTQKVAENPCRQGIGNEFFVTGRGGLPTTPNETLNSDNVRVDLLQPVASSKNSPSATITKPATTVTATRVPAQGWIFNDKGQVVLTAYDPTNTGSQRPFNTAAACPAR